MFQVTLERRDNGHVTTSARAERFLMRGREDHYDAELVRFLIDNFLLGKSTDFPVPTGAGDDPGKHMVFQHHIAGTGFPVRIVNKTDESHDDGNDE